MENTMRLSQVKRDAMKIVGITTRTNNRDEMDPKRAKIGSVMGRYFGDTLADRMVHRKNPGVTYCIYTEFESDENGEYTYYIGEEVDSFDGQDAGFETLTIPAQAYARFTIGPGEMPGVCINAWQKIWQMKTKDFGGKRSYIADFEVYDERAKDLKSTTLDICVGIQLEVHSVS